MKPANCDGAGSCAVPTPPVADCAPYVCGATGACKTTCGAAADCFNAFCTSTSGGVCCPFYPANTIQVDGTKGVDSACCGAGTGASACATIARAATNAAGTGVMPMTLAVANPPNGKDWVADPFPITLGEGLILSAPGLYFSAPSVDAGVLFLVTNPIQDAGPAPTVIEGAAGAPIHVGFDSNWNQAHGLTGIAVTQAALHLLNAELQSPPRLHPVDEMAVYVADAGVLILGNDGLGASGTVWIGNPDAGQGYLGISCNAGGTVTDKGSTTAPSVWAQNMRFGITDGNGCILDLTNGPRFGLALNDGGTCDSHPDYDGIFIDGLQTDAIVSNATFDCFNGMGLSVGAGTFHGDHDLFLFNAIGAWPSSTPLPNAGRAHISNSTFRHNDIGVYASGPVDLSKGNEISCNGGSGSSAFPNPHPSAGLEEQWWFNPIYNVNAEGILWDHWDADAGHTETWDCSGIADAGPCTCSGASSCPKGPQPLQKRVDVLVFGGFQPGLADDANGGLAPDGCPLP
jgi:hypothetical protein